MMSGFGPALRRDPLTLAHAHTFPGLPSSWGAAHSDVTPVVGLALLAVAGL